MSNDFIQNAVNALYQSNELMALKAELANLKAKADQSEADNARLKAECQARQAENSVLAVECDSLKAQVERLTKAGDLMCRMAGNNQVINRHWKTAKKGLQP